MKVGIIDYEVGNIFSVANAISYLGHVPIISRSRNELISCDKIILPGVGNFSKASAKLEEYELSEIIKDFIRTGKSFLGICIGMHLLMENSDESVGSSGLGIIKGTVKKITDTKETNKKIIIPHVCWSKVNFKSEIFKDFSADDFYYFVHSYTVVPQNNETILGRTKYFDIDINAAIKMENLIGVQFHPERSGPSGLKFLRNFIEKEIIS